MDHLQEIKSRLSIEELMSGHVQLKRAGRNLKGLCPFHQEKTPSFMVSPDKEIAYCFGCQQGGDIFKVTQLLENCDFGEAVKMLAERTGVKLPRSLPKSANQRLRVIEINQATMEFFQQKLNENPDRKEIFLKRGLTEKTIREFELGYAPDSFTALKDHLIQKDFTEKELLEAGVLSQRSLADRTSFDRFRDRLMFPIFDHQGNPVGFGGRVIGKGEPKYLNSPETPAYHKSLVLYGLHLAKEAIKKEGGAVFVEGYMDVIAAHQAGTRHVISTSGTALTLEQLKLIKRTTNRIAFAFDQDPAGLEATLRAITLAQGDDFEIRIVTIPHGKDPDECIRENPEAWQKAVKAPLAVMDFYVNYAKRQFDPETVEGKKGMLQFLLPLVKQYPSEVEQGYHLERLALELKTDVKLLWNDLKKIKPPQPFLGQTPEEVPAEPARRRSFSREMYLLGFIFQYPHFYPLVAESLIDNIPFDPETEPLYNSCKTIYCETNSLEPEAVKAAAGQGASEKADLYRLLIEEHYPDFSEAAVEREINHLIRAINRNNLYKIQKECEFKIRSAGTSEDRHLLLNEYNEILKLNSKL